MSIDGRSRYVPGVQVGTTKGDGQQRLPVSRRPNSGPEVWRRRRDGVSATARGEEVANSRRGVRQAGAADRGEGWVALDRITRRPSSRAATPVVPEPQNGSSTMSPGSVMRRRSRASGDALRGGVVIRYVAARGRGVHSPEQHHRPRRPALTAVDARRFIWVLFDGALTARVLLRARDGGDVRKLRGVVGGKQGKNLEAVPVSDDRP